MKKIYRNILIILSIWALQNLKASDSPSKAEEIDYGIKHVSNIGMVSELNQGSWKPSCHSRKTRRNITRYRSASPFRHKIVILPNKPISLESPSTLDPQPEDNNDEETATEKMINVKVRKRIIRSSR